MKRPEPTFEQLTYEDVKKYVKSLKRTDYQMVSLRKEICKHFKNQHVGVCMQKLIDDKVIRVISPNKPNKVCIESIFARIEIDKS